MTLGEKFEQWVAVNSVKVIGLLMIGSILLIPKAIKLLYNTPFKIAKWYKFRSKVKKTKHKQLNRYSMKEIYEDRGLKAENHLANNLVHLLPNAEIYSNVYVPTQNGTTEIDVLAVDKTGVYVFESKNMNGKILGDIEKEQWEVKYGKGLFKGNNKVQEMYNPILQNEGHINKLKEYLNTNGVNVPREKIHSYIYTHKTKTSIKKESHLKNEDIHLIRSKDIKYTPITKKNNKKFKYKKMIDNVDLKAINDLVEKKSGKNVSIITKKEHIKTVKKAKKYNKNKKRKRNNLNIFENKSKNQKNKKDSKRKEGLNL